MPLEAQGSMTEKWSRNDCDMYPETIPIPEMILDVPLCCFLSKSRVDPFPDAAREFQEWQYNMGLWIACILRVYRGILVYNICLINISNSVFDGATKKSVLNIERS